MVPALTLISSLHVCHSNKLDCLDSRLLHVHVYGLSTPSPPNPYAAAAAGGGFGLYKMMLNPLKMTETLTHGYSSESTQQELMNDYQNDRVHMVFISVSVLVLWTKLASALEGFTFYQAQSGQGWSN